MPTLLELFHSSGLKDSVKPDKETLVKQETSGIRIKSAVEINNPLIYGNEATRIALRSTPLLEEIKGGTNPNQDGGGGLIGGKITQARNYVNDKLGIPSAQIPTSIIDDIEKQNSLEPVKPKDNGTGVGKFLKQTGGGNPNTIGKQALGQGIGLAKDKLRGALFGEGGGVGSAEGKNFAVEYTSNDRTYTDVNKSKTLPSDSDGGVKKDLEGTKLDISKISPIYGIRRGPGKGVSRFTATDPYLGTGVDLSNKITPMEDVVGWGKSDTLNILSQDEYELTDDGGLKVGEKTYYDIIPFHIGKLGEKPTIFRSIVTGVSETVSPTWNSNKFVGNPFNFYTYDGVERSVTFTLSIYCSSPVELNVCWERITRLTKMAYPSITKSRLVNPPIVDFRLGDIYVSKKGFIESLSYTLPDTGTWETDGDIGYLPKYIEVSLTIKFIEHEGVLSALYGYKKSKAAVEKINEDRVNMNEAQNTRLEADGQEKQEAPPKVDDRGKAQEPNVSVVTQGTDKAKGLLKEKTPTLPSVEEAGIEEPVKNQSSNVDVLDGETPTTFVKKTTTKHSLTGQQGQVFMSYRRAVGPRGRVQIIGLKDIPGERKYVQENFDANTIFLKAEKGTLVGVYAVSPSGSPMLVYDSRNDD